MSRFERSFGRCLLTSPQFTELMSELMNAPGQGEGASDQGSPGVLWSVSEKKLGSSVPSLTLVDLSFCWSEGLEMT